MYTPWAIHLGKLQSLTTDDSAFNPTEGSGLFIIYNVHLQLAHRYINYLQQQRYTIVACVPLFGNIVHYCLHCLYIQLFITSNYNMITWRLTILIIFRGWISQDNLSVAMDRNNLPVLILNLLRIRDVIIYNLMTLHSYHNTCGNYEK